MGMFSAGRQMGKRLISAELMRLVRHGKPALVYPPAGTNEQRATLERVTAHPPQPRFDLAEWCERKYPSS